MEAKIQELRKTLESVKDFKLVNFHWHIVNREIYVKLEKKLPSGYLSIKEKIIKISDIDREIRITKTL